MLAIFSFCSSVNGVADSLKSLDAKVVAFARSDVLNPEKLLVKPGRSLSYKFKASSTSKLFFFAYSFTNSLSLFLFLKPSKSLPPAYAAKPIPEALANGILEIIPKGVNL